MFNFKHMKHFFTFTVFLLLSRLVYAETFYSVKEISNMYMQPSSDSPIIYPIEQGKELILKKNQEDWANVLDEKTGLVGWIQKDFISKSKPQNIIKAKNYANSFKVFEERVLEMSKSIKEAISIETFLKVEHLGGAAAAITADDEWFKEDVMQIKLFKFMIYGRIKTNHHLFCLLEMSGVEQFIILSGPHRPRYLKSSK